MFKRSKESILILLIVRVFLCGNRQVNGDSCQDAIVEFGTNDTIVDTNNETWTIHSDGEIYKNGQLAGFSASVIELVYWDKIVYQSNQNHGWWGWISNNWSGVSDPNLISNLTAASGCSYTTVSDSTSLPTTMSPDSPPPSYFVPHSCNDSSYIGKSCNISMKPCDALKPCQNWGYCTNDPSLRNGYSCTCLSGLDGTNCEFDIQVCQSNTCLYNGTCKQLNNTDFDCNCTQGRVGVHCELLVNYCTDITCLNRGVCSSLPLNYTCECLPTSSGRHCEYVQTNLRIREYVSKSVGFIAIIFLCTSAGYIISLDILTYVFNIDLTAKDRDQIRRKRALCKKGIRKFPRKTICRRRKNKIASLPQPKKTNRTTLNIIK